MPAQFAQVTGRLAFWSWLPITSWRCFVGSGCIVIALFWTAFPAPPPAFAQQNRPREEASTAKDASASKQVKVARVAEKPLERTTAALGSLVAFDQATISVKVPGRLRSIGVDLGSIVCSGNDKLDAQ